jgi:hypothetical protein
VRLHVARASEGTAHTERGGELDVAVAAHHQADIRQMVAGEGTRNCERAAPGDRSCVGDHAFRREQLDDDVGEGAHDADKMHGG